MSNHEYYTSYVVREVRKYDYTCVDRTNLDDPLPFIMLCIIGV